MNEMAPAGALFFVLCGAAALGAYVRAKLPKNIAHPKRWRSYKSRFRCS